MHALAVKIACISFSALQLAVLTEPELLSHANVIERLTISGILAIAVIYLYRENVALRAKGQQETEELKTFVAAQTLASQSVAQLHAESLSKVATALQSQQNALALQIDSYNRHISHLIDHRAK